MVNHDPRYRRLWMVPRNKRKIPPLDLAQFVELFTAVEEFSGNVEAQDELSRVLERANLKGGELQYHSNSGGMRTYASQMEALGLIFKYDGRYYPTISGQKLMDADRPLFNLQLNLLRHQYPSVYGRGSNVKIHPGIKVKPFLFLLELMDLLSFMTDEEMMVPVVYGHSRSDFDRCADKIALLRSGSSFESVIDNAEQDLYTPRTKGSNVVARLSDVRDIANTFKNYLESAGLISVGYSEERTRRYVPLFSFGQLLEEFSIDPDDYLEVGDDPMNFTRRYGRADRRKDTRRISTTARNRNPRQVALIAQYRQLLESDYEQSDDSIMSKMAEDWGLSLSEVRDNLSVILGQRDQWFESEYLRLSRGGQETAIAFEKATSRILNRCGESAAIPFSAEHVGQRRSQGLGGYVDIIVTNSEGRISLVDAKAIVAYCLPHDDIIKMSSTYLANYPELLSAEKKLRLSSTVYVSATLCNTIEDRLVHLRNKTGTHAAGLTARALYSATVSDRGDSISSVLFPDAS